MSRRSKKPKAPAYKPVPQTTVADATKSATTMMDKQSGIIGALLDPLVSRAESVMDSNPGLLNFMEKTGQAKGKVDDALTGPGSLLAQIDEALGFERNPEPSPQPGAVGANPQGLTPEQLAQLQNNGVMNGTYNFGGTPYNINDDMRNRFNR
jgi:hypothetical protein